MASGLIIKKSCFNLWEACLLLAFSLFLFQPVEAQQIAGSLIYLNPSSGSVAQGSEFSVVIAAQTAEKAINAGCSTLYFPADDLEVISLSKDNSIFTIWPEEPFFNNASGTVHFAGGLPHPGFQGKGDLLTINFRAKQTGSIELKLGRAQLLASDGLGTDTLLYLKEAKYFIAKQPLLAQAKDEEAFLPVLISSTHPQETEWYNNDSPVFNWFLSEEASEISFLLDKEPETAPDNIPEARLTSKAYQDLAEGVWYFHLKVKDENGWSKAWHYKAQIDIEPPRPFQIAVDNQGDPTNPNPELYFKTTDQTSGVAYYKIQLAENVFKELLAAQVSSFYLPSQTPGEKEVAVRAVDWAGNSVESKTFLKIEPIASPQIDVCPKSYFAGEETLYLAGQALPQVEIALILETIEGRLIAQWRTKSDEQGNWSFRTKETIDTGFYQLRAMARDSRGALSQFSSACSLAVILNGLKFGRFFVTFRQLSLGLLIILGLSLLFAFIVYWLTRRSHQQLNKETAEVKSAVRESFNRLRGEIEEKVSSFDQQAGLNSREKEVYQAIEHELNQAEKIINKEIKDIEKALE